MRLGRGMFDPRLAVLETNGTVLADVDETWLAKQDPFVSLIAPHDGTFVLQLREATYGGNGDCHYRLHVGTFPRPTSVYPLGGKAGQAHHQRQEEDEVQGQNKKETRPANEDYEDPFGGSNQPNQRTKQRELKNFGADGF